MGCKITFLGLLALVVFSISAAAHLENSIHITDNGFEPKILEIEAGETVVFENVGQNPHWPASNIHPTHEIYPEFDSKSIILPGSSWSFTFDKPGEWRMHDHAYPDIIGTIIVKGEQAESPSGFGEFVLKVLTAIFPPLSPTPKSITGFFFSDEPASPTPEKKIDLPYNESIDTDADTIFRDDDQLYSYIKKFGTKQTFTHLHELELTKGDCHQTAHRGGRFAYQIYGDEVFKQCTIDCHSGCYHGAIEYYFKEHGTTDIPAALNTICGNEENGFFAHQCFHGIGHGLMAWADYELFEALHKCDLLVEGKNSCYSGAFMENIVASLADNQSVHKSKYVSEDPLYPCNAVDDTYKRDCYFFQTARMKELFDNDFSKIADTCATVPDEYRLLCFESMGRDASGNTVMNVNASIAFCQSAKKGPYRTSCLKGAVQDMFWEAYGQDRAIAFCKKLTDKAEKDACYEVIIERAPLVISSQEELKKFCDNVEKSYYEKCSARAVA